MKRSVALFTILLFHFNTFSQKNTGQTVSEKPFTIGITTELQSKVLGEKRILNIYLPDGYSKNDTLKYPVVYLLDGSADEDFIHVCGLYQFNSFEWVNRVKRSIIVGIANVDRKRDFTFPTTIDEDKKKFPSTGHSDNFIIFLENEFQPFIAANFKTTSDKTIIGESLGGLLASQILFEKPKLFNKYIIISPSLWWDDGSLLNKTSELLTENFSSRTDIYIGVGKEGLTPTTKPHVMEVDANMLADKIRTGKSKAIHFHFDYLPEEDHATIGHQAVFNALKYFSTLK